MYVERSMKWGNRGLEEEESATDLEERETSEEITDPPCGTSTIHTALKGMQWQSTARAVGAIVVITQLQ